MDESGCTSWLVESISKHNKEVQTVFLTDKNLKKYLPASSPTGHAIIDSPFIKPSKIDDEDEDLEAEVDTLQDECDKIVQKSIVPTSPLPREVGSDQRTPSLSPSDDEEDSKLASTTEAEVALLCLLALGVTYDPEQRRSLTCPLCPSTWTPSSRHLVDQLSGSSLVRPSLL